MMSLEEFKYKHEREAHAGRVKNGNRAKYATFFMPWQIAQAFGENNSELKALSNACNQFMDKEIPPSAQLHAFVFFQEFLACHRRDTNAGDLCQIMTATNELLMDPERCAKRYSALADEVPGAPNNAIQFIGLLSLACCSSLLWGLMFFSKAYSVTICFGLLAGFWGALFSLAVTAMHCRDGLSAAMESLSAELCQEKGNRIA